MTSAEVRAWQAERTKAAAPERSERPNSSSVPHFTGKPLDSDSGTYLFRFRAYDPELNRWKSFDPSGFPDGANNGVYTSSPLSVLDPTGLANKSVVWLSSYYDTSDPSEYGIYLEVSGVQEAWKNNIDIYDRNSAATSEPSDDTHYLDDGDTFSHSSIGSLSDLSAFSNYTQVYVFAHGIFDTTAPGNPFLGYGVGNAIYQAGDFYNAASNVVWVMGCTQYNGGAGNETTLSIANSFINPTLQHLYE
jgi:RHS repeat-associated protein